MRRFIPAVLLVAAVFAACGRSSDATSPNTSATVSGTAVSGNHYSMSGQLVNAAVTLLATAAANEDWTSAGSLAGDFITGKITYGDALLPLQFSPGLADARPPPVLGVTPRTSVAGTVRRDVDQFGHDNSEDEFQRTRDALLVVVDGVH